MALIPVILALSLAVTPEMEVAKPGAVRPSGWLLDRARAARDGYTGHLDEVSDHFRRAWTAEWNPRGNYLNWSVDDEEGNKRANWSAEGGSYWFDGLVKLAWQLDDQDLKALARRRLEPVLERTGENSIGFLWWMDRRDPQQLNEVVNNGWVATWVQGNSARVLSAWYEATGDERALRALRYAFNWKDLAEALGPHSATLASGAAEAYRLTGDPEVKAFLDLCRAKFATGRSTRQFIKAPWTKLADTLNLRREHAWHLGLPSRHGVMASESLLSVLRLWQTTGEQAYLDSVLAWYRFFDEHCSQPYGVTMMDEEWGWRGARRGTETCDVAAEAYTKRCVFAALADGRWGDQLELAFFNAGPACVSRDFRRNVYFQMPNRTGREKGEAEEMSCAWDTHVRYDRSAWPLCCTAALNRILPNYVQGMWMKTAAGGLAATLYGPCTFETELPVGKVAFAERTDYPFDERIVLNVTAAPGKEFPLRLRIPGWCAAAEIAVNGAAVCPPVKNGFATLTRAWKTGDAVTLRFPMTPVAWNFRDNNEYGRLRRSLYVGPILFAAAVPAKDDNTPAGPFVEPVLPQVAEPKSWTVERRPLPKVWSWQLDEAPVRLHVSAADGQPLTLVPYGCTKLRISAFGVEDRGKAN